MSNKVVGVVVENLADLLSVALHTEDFHASRSEYINQRIRMLALLFAAAVLLWIPIDYLTLPEAIFTQLVGIRIGVALLYLVLALWQSRANTGSLTVTQARLMLLVFIPTIFYAIGQSLMAGVSSPMVEMVYSFYPFIIVVQLAIFPLALVEGALLVLIPFAMVIGLSWPITEVVWITLWLLALTAVLSSWAQLSQLHMLLRLYHQATRDPLTCLFNRRALMERLEVEMEAARRYGRAMSVMLFDLDKFKHVNDNYGHLTGDKVLQIFAQVITDTLRNVDVVGRYGGEEFLAVLPDTDAKGAADVADRVRSACHSVLIPSKAGDLTFTTSVGVAQQRDLEDSATLINRADEALYSAKDSGRDRVVIAP